MNRILSLIAALMLTLSTFAASIQTDRKWYLAGEMMAVTITTDDANIAYAELCNMRGIIGETAICLVLGKGTGAIEIPGNAPSGYYVLSAYTRDNVNVSRRIIAIINPLIKSEFDDIDWIPLSDDSLSYASILEDETITAASLADKKELGIRETEGHIVMAHVKNVYNNTTFTAKDIIPSLSIVGKQVHYFEGKMLNDTTAIFFTFGLHGKQTIILSAASITGKSLQIEVISPFVQLVPKKLPHLVFHYNRAEVESHSKDMQLHQIAIAPEKEELVIGGKIDDAATEKGVPLNYDNKIFGLTPINSYNLDEYRQFYTIKEVLTEYVNSISVGNPNGVRSLITFDKEEGWSSWPAMVFIDGMPVIDVDRLLKYDARRIHFINEYAGKFTFGNGIYKGIVSFVTRSGQLTNYPTEPGTQYLVYQFPE